jgi:hypothetical protein
MTIKIKKPLILSRFVWSKSVTIMMCFGSCLSFSRFAEPLQVVSVVLTRPSSSASPSFLTSKLGASRICVEVMFEVSGSGLQNAESESDQSQRHENRRSTSLNNVNCIQVRGTKVHIIRRWVSLMAKMACPHVHRGDMKYTWQHVKTNSFADSSITRQMCRSLESGCSWR